MGSVDRVLGQGAQVSRVTGQHDAATGVIGCGRNDRVGCGDSFSTGVGS